MTERLDDQGHGDKVDVPTPRTDDLAKGLGRETTERALKIAMRHARELERELSTARSAAVASSEPEEDWSAAHATNYLQAILHYTGGFYGDAIKHGMPAQDTANKMAHLERAARGLERIAQEAIAKSQRCARSASEPLTLLREIRDRLDKVDTEIAVRALGNNLLNRLNAAADRRGVKE